MCKREFDNLIDVCYYTYRFAKTVYLYLPASDVWALVYFERVKMPKTPQEILASHDPTNDEVIQSLCDLIDYRLEYAAYKLRNPAWGYRIMFTVPRTMSIGYYVRTVARIYMEHGWQVKIYEGTPREPDWSIEFKLPEGL